jgi:hypothetical protein
MLKILANNKELDLGSIDGIELSINPGLFEMDSFEGSYAIPFSIPIKTNAHIFNFANKISNAQREIIELEGEIWHSGIRMATGLISASIFEEPDEINCNFYVDNGLLFKQLNKTNMPQNNYGGRKPVEFKTNQDGVTYWSVDDDNYVIYPVKNLNYFKGTHYENWTLGDMYKFQNYYNNKVLVTVGVGPSTVTPFPLLYKVLRYLFINLNFEYQDNYFDQNVVMRGINIFNTNDAITSEYVLNSGNLLRTLYQVDLANHLPDIPSTQFLKSIQAFFNVVFYVKHNMVKVVDRLAMIQDSSFEDITDKLVGYYTKTINDVSFDGVALNFELDQKDLNVASLPDVSKIKDIDELYILPNDITNPYPYYTVLVPFVFAAYSQFINSKDLDPESVDDDWFWYPYSFEYPSGQKRDEYCAMMGYYFGKKEFNINANLNTLPSQIFADPDETFDYYFPKVLQQGNGVYHTDKTDFSLRLMLYTGIKNVEGQLRPHGSYKNGSMAITAYWSYQNRWEEFIAWYKEAVKEDYEMYFQLNASEIKNFDFSVKREVNQNLFFVKSMQVQLTRTEIKPAKCTLIKAI